MNGQKYWWARHKWANGVEYTAVGSIQDKKAPKRKDTENLSRHNFNN